MQIASDYKCSLSIKVGSFTIFSDIYKKDEHSKHDEIKS